MIDFYYSPTPNGWKVAIALEEMGLDYRPILVDLPAGEQLSPAFRAINPNAKIPAIVDPDAPGSARAIWESGAILLYLMRRTGRFGSDAPDLEAWMYWQAAGLGPMAGQLSHFVNYAPAGMDYPISRYRGEFERCLGVLEGRLEGQAYILGDYSIADMMCFPWVFIAKRLGTDLARFPALTRWRAAIKARPAVIRAIELGKDRQFTETADAGSTPALFNQGAGHVMGE